MNEKDVDKENAKNIQPKNSSEAEKVDGLHSEHHEGKVFDDGTSTSVKSIEKEMKSSYLDYAMSVIMGRALPDVRDGLKPVHRRILFAMHEMGLTHNKPFKKCARVIGEVLGKFHPHGDTAIYDALVRMAQPFSMRYPLVEGQGNFGSIDGDRAAAMRYTEARLSKIADEMLKDIEKETVDFTRNFDNSLDEPLFLPSRIPNLLLNGSSGIAVGMATNIPPHNLGEVSDAIINLIDNPDMNVNEIMKYIKGPDFPTGGLIYGRQNIFRAYKTGRGQIIVRAKTRFEEKGKRTRIIVDEIPFMVNKAELLKDIVQLVRDKKINGISDLRDESDKHGMRVVISLKQGVNPEIILNKLFKHTKLQTTFGIIMLTLINGEPRVVGIKEMLLSFINHRRMIIRRALTFDLKKAKARREVVQGLIIAINNIDDVVTLIKSSKTVDSAKQSLIEKYSLTQVQAGAILDMKLQKLISLEQEKLNNELKELDKSIEDLTEKLGDEKNIFKIIKDETTEIKQKYGDSRRTEIIDEESVDINIEDMVEDEEVIILLTNKGYIKRTPLATYRLQARGGKGVRALTTREEDFVKEVIVTKNLSYILFFTNMGRVYKLKAYQIPQYDRISKGKPLINFLNLDDNEVITQMISLKQDDFINKLLIFTTRRGIVKRSRTEEFLSVRNGIRAINLDRGDSLVGVGLSDGKREIILATKYGLAVRFKEQNVRVMGRNARGVIGIRLRQKNNVSDEVVDMIIADRTRTLLTVTEKGYGKRTRISDYRLTGRGGKGVINIKISDKNGLVIRAKSVLDSDELIMITKNGITIRVPVKQVSVIGRNTQGVRIIRLNEDDKLVDVEVIRQELIESDRQADN